MPDVVIRNGKIIDGTGAAGFVGDVSIVGDQIVAIGVVPERGVVEIDADGALVTPGFVDVHSHYDGQLTWESRVLPSTYHGVTTVVAGNCGLGFAPATAERRQQLIELMEGVEDIPEAVLSDGLTWAWESFDSYLDLLRSRSFDADVGVYIGHTPVRVFVMGDRATADHEATDAEIAQMGELVADAVAAGALGFSTSRTHLHRSSTGASVPTLRAAHRELIGIATAMGRTGRGALQLVVDFTEGAPEFELLRELARASGRPVSFSLVQFPERPAQYRQLLDLVAAARADGLDIKAQVAPRSPGLLMGLETSLHPFVSNPKYVALAALSPHAKLERLRDPAVRAAILASDASNEPVAGRASADKVRRWEMIFPLGDPPNYEPAAELSLAAIAEREGCDPAELAFDMLTEGDGTSLLFVPLANYIDGGLDAVGDMLSDPNTMVGIGDGGAHVGVICDASFPTTLLAHWGRDRSSGRLPIELLVNRHTQAPAVSLGLTDRGVLRPGFRADINVIDFDTLQPDVPYLQYGLPAGGKRLFQRAKGYRHTLVAGVETYRDGEPTGALPGRLVQGLTTTTDFNYKGERI